MAVSPPLRAAVRALAPPPGAPLGALRRTALLFGMPALVKRYRLRELLDALDTLDASGRPALGGAGGAAPLPPHERCDSSAEIRRLAHGPADQAVAIDRRADEGRGEGAGQRANAVHLPAAASAAIAHLHRRGRTTCLYRALTGFASLRAGGEPVHLVIGVAVERGELLAHAWLEKAGQPLGERDDPRSRYAVAFVYPGERGAPGAPEDGMNVGKASKDVILTELQDGSGVLLDLKSKFYFTLNRTGVAVWKLLAAGSTATSEALAAAITEQFAAPDVEAVRQDVEALLRDLESEGLLGRAGA